MLGAVFFLEQGVESMKEVRVLKGGKVRARS